MRRIPIALVFVALLAGCGGGDDESGNGTDGTVGAEPASLADIEQIAEVRCVPCHAPNPSIDGYPAAQSLDFTDPANLEANKQAIYQAVVVEKRMPFANNETGMTQDERDRVASWAQSD